jgi:hypothetical protein
VCAYLLGTTASTDAISQQQAPGWDDNLFALEPKLPDAAAMLQVVLHFIYLRSNTLVCATPWF